MKKYDLNLGNILYIRLHCSTTYVDAVYCYRPNSVVCWSVCRSACLSH